MAIVENIAARAADVDVDVDVEVLWYLGGMGGGGRGTSRR